MIHCFWSSYSSFLLDLHICFGELEEAFKVVSNTRYFEVTRHNLFSLVARRCSKCVQGFVLDNIVVSVKGASGHSTSFFHLSCWRSLVRVRSKLIQRARFIEKNI